MESFPNELKTFLNKMKMFPKQIETSFKLLEMSFHKLEMDLQKLETSFPKLGTSHEMLGIYNKKHVRIIKKEYVVWHWSHDTLYMQYIINDIRYNSPAIPSPIRISINVSGRAIPRAKKTISSAFRRKKRSNLKSPPKELINGRWPTSSKPSTS